MKQTHFIHESQIESYLNDKGIDNAMSQRIALDLSKAYNRVTFTTTIEMHYNPVTHEYVVTTVQPLPHAQ